VLLLSVVLGIINAFDVPARQALVYDMMTNKDDVPGAIALNSSMVHMARLVGPALSGIVLERLGAAAAFSMNAISFVAVIVSLLMMKLAFHTRPQRSTNVMSDLKNGFIYLKETPSINRVMIMLALISLISLPYITLLPVYAKDVFQGNAAIFGYLHSFIGLGAISGAYFLASRKPGADLKGILFINTLIFGVGLLLVSQTGNLYLSLLFLVITGFGMMSQTTISNTLIQLAVTPTMRGRVISYYAMAFFGMQPIGSLLVGAWSDKIGPQNTLFIQGIITIIIALMFLPFLTPKLLRRRDKMKIEQLKETTIETMG
jgi:MFS family permease